jgi:hypothetical protein
VRPAAAEDDSLFPDDQEAPRVPALVVEALRRVQVMVTTMGLAPPFYWPKPRPRRYPPPHVHIPIVVKTPIIPQDTIKPAGGGGPPPNGAPEPASLVSGLVGSGIALAAWLRRRRRPTREGGEGAVGPEGPALQPA